MKTILVILDGVSEEKIKELSFKTPLEYAVTPILDKIIKEGTNEKRKFYIEGREPDSLSCILSILGVHESSIPKNRAYLEAIAAGINVEEHEVVLRCNLISVNNDKLKSFNGANLTNKEINEASYNVNASGIKFYHLGEYRNLLVLQKNSELLSLTTKSPHENIGMNINELLKEVKKINELNEFITNNHFYKNNNHYMYYPWGVSEKVDLPSYLNLHNKTCSCVCHADIMKGIAKAMKINVPILKNSTGDVDTDLKEKSKALLNEIKYHDVVIAHINGTDEVSHRRDLHGKISFIEKIDKEFIKEIHENTNNTRLIILSDHQTSSITGKHERGFVDYICNIREE